MAPRSLESEEREGPLWVPENADGSGWATVDWTSVIQGSRYFYRHAEPDAESRQMRPAWYCVVTRLDTPNLHSPHENSYYVAAEQLVDLLAEFILLSGAETVWRIEPIEQPPPAATLR